MLERQILPFGLSVDQCRVPLIERSPASILPSEPNRYAVEEQRAERQRLGHSVVHRSRAAAHLQSLIEKPLDLGVDGKSFRISRKCCSDFAELCAISAGVDLV